MTMMLEITCRDSIVARDGRPFGAGQGNRMRSFDWPLPSVLAGSLRTTLGKAAKRDFSPEAAEDLLQVEVAGPLPRTREQLYLPAPEDCVLHPDGRVLRAVPQREADGGCDWPNGAPLRPVGLTQAQASEDFKPAEAPAWWPPDRYAAWLAGEDIAFDEHFLCSAEKDERTHVKIDPAVGASEESQLFTTAALALSHLPRYRMETKREDSTKPKKACRKETGLSRFVEIMLSARIRAGGWCEEVAAKLDALHPFGGERRLAHWKTGADVAAWQCPPKLRGALAQAQRVRMILTTPAVFSDGWRPGWLGVELEGSPPGANARLRLVGVSIARWKAVSGWSLAHRPEQPRGPKAVKRMVPAGGVYFFEIVDGNAAALADRWLEPVSDDVQDRRDGFGLAVWGTW
jgi:CRISPR-associated protein Cmr3